MWTWEAKVWTLVDSSKNTHLIAFAWWLLLFRKTKCLKTKRLITPLIKRALLSISLSIFSPNDQRTVQTEEKKSLTTSRQNPTSYGPPVDDGHTRPGTRRCLTQGPPSQLSVCRTHVCLLPGVLPEVDASTGTVVALDSFAFFCL